MRAADCPSAPPNLKCGFNSMSKTVLVTDIYKFGDMCAADIDFQQQEY